LNNCSDEESHRQRLLDDQGWGAVDMPAPQEAAAPLKAGCNVSIEAVCAHAAALSECAYAYA